MILSGAELLVRTLKEHDVEYIFGGGGSALRPIHDALLDHLEFKYILSLHEMCTVAMAEGYSKASGKVAFAVLHAAVGTVNALGSLFAAQRDKTPVVVLAGERETHLLGRRSYNESLVPLPETVRPFVKWAWQIQRADKIPEEIGKAFKIARASPAGPVFLSLPMDMMVANVPAATPFSRSCDIAVKIRGNPEYISRAAEMILEAKKPVIVVGSGVGHSRASKEVLSLAKAIGAPIFVERNSFLIDFPAKTDVFLGEFSLHSPLVKNADLLIVVGGRTDIEMHYNPTAFYESRKIIQITPDVEDLGLLHHVDIGLVADPQAVMTDILVALNQAGPRSYQKSARNRVNAIKAQKKAHRDTIQIKIKERWESTPVSPSRIFQELAQIVDCDPVVITVSPSSEGMALAAIEPSTIFAQNGAGYLGWGLPASLGVWLAMPERRVICVLGDGGFMFGPQALWTAAKYRIPVFTLVLNNRAYLVDRSKKMIAKKRFIGTELGKPDMDFAAMGESMGVKGYRITKPVEVRRILEQAWNTDGPVIVDALVSEEPSRELLSFH